MNLRPLDPVVDSSGQNNLSSYEVIFIIPTMFDIELRACNSNVPLWIFKLWDLVLVK